MGGEEGKLTDYFAQQLEYDHTDDPHPPITRAVVRNQHRWIREAIVKESERGPVHLLDVGCGWGDFSQ